jgi:magnesium transporter
MLSVYGAEKGCLVEHGAEVSDSALKTAVWLDLVEPTHDEESAVEAAINIDIPTRGELAEIEVSSRLYQEDGAAFMTANLIRRGDDERPESSPVTFIIKGHQLITVRYHHPQAFPVYVRQAMKPQSTLLLSNGKEAESRAANPRIWKNFWARLARKAISIQRSVKAWSPLAAWWPSPRP